MKEAKIILASASPRRRDLLNQVLVNFEIITANIEEKITSDIPDRVVMELSGQKALTVAANNYDNVVVAADTVVACDGRILGKAKDYRDAFEMIKSIQGKYHSVFTGVTICYRGRSFSFAEETKVYVYGMTDKQIEEYVKSGDGSGKAGNYAIQGAFARYVYRIEGDYNNVVGLPVARTLYEIDKMLCEVKDNA